MAVILPWLAVLPLFLLSPSAGLQTASLDRDSTVSRETFTFEGDIAWVVQISDLHVSSYHHDRGEDLQRLFAPALQIIRPSLVLITGDITDAKNKRRTSTRQDEFEWIQYKKIMDAVIKKSGLEKRAFFDIRGNHDKYGVPYIGSDLDFFSKYSISSQLNRHGAIQSISLMGSHWNYHFLGIDDSMEIGLRGPSNLFGHPTDRRMDTADSELGYWDQNHDAMATTIAFGHFPMSFIASSEKGNTYENIFAKHSVATYICGHLHAKFSKELWRIHSVKANTGFQKHTIVGQFWEWELGDWRESRMIRILAIHRGQVSFVDIQLGVDSVEEMQTTILVTHPLDSRNMNRITLGSETSRNDISALVFSSNPILNVTAKIFDASRDFELVEELTLHTSVLDVNAPLFHTKFNISKYKNKSGARFWLQVAAIDVHGRRVSTTPRPFSVDGKLGKLPTTWIAYLVFFIKWEKLYLILLGANISFLILLLLLPKLLNHFMQRNPIYQRWAMSVSISLPFKQRRYIFWPLWFLIEGTEDGRLWWAMVLYFLCLLKFTWFWGRATSEDGGLARMSLHGWTVELPDVGMRREGVGHPDSITIVLPFMYFIVSPLFLLVYCLHAEKSAFYLHACKKKCGRKESAPLNGSRPGLQPLDAPSETSMSLKGSKCKICRGYARTGLLLACFVFSYLHFRVCSSLMAAYGVGPVFFSPAVSWVPPLLLLAAVYSTQPRSHMNSSAAKI